MASTSQAQSRMKIPHAIVWLDHREALVCLMPSVESPFVQHHLHAPEAVGHPHRDGHARDEHSGRFFEDIARSLEPVSEVLVVGPARAKNEFHAFTADRKPELHARILGVETLDHPTPGQLVAHARTFFKKTDAMRGTAPLNGHER